jgi:hypothetical protein
MHATKLHVKIKGKEIKTTTLSISVVITWEMISTGQQMLSADACLGENF